jgi:hypothetical protein
MRKIRQVKTSSTGYRAVCRDKQFEPIFEDRPGEENWVIDRPPNKAEP